MNARLDSQRSDWRVDDALPGKTSLSDEDFFAYIYAVLHSSSYRLHYLEFLKADFPHIPQRKYRSVVNALSPLGKQLIDVHLLKNVKSNEGSFVGNPSCIIETAEWKDNAVAVTRDSGARFLNISEPIWDFHVGGYQVCEKWLKDRKGLKLSKADIEHYQKIVAAIGETIRIMKEIDEVIDAHGGWPLK